MWKVWRCLKSLMMSRVIKYVTSLMISIIVSICWIFNIYTFKVYDISQQISRFTLNEEVLFLNALYMIASLYMCVALKIIVIDLDKTEQPQTRKLFIQSVLMVIFALVLFKTPFYLIQYDHINEKVLFSLSLLLNVVYVIFTFHFFYQPLAKDYFHWRKILAIIVFFMLYIFAHFFLCCCFKSYG